MKKLQLLTASLAALALASCGIIKEHALENAEPNLPAFGLFLSFSSQ